MSFRRKEDPLYQIKFENNNETDYFNGIDFIPTIHYK